MCVLQSSRASQFKNHTEITTSIHHPVTMSWDGRYAIYPTEVSFSSNKSTHGLIDVLITILLIILTRCALFSHHFMENKLGNKFAMFCIFILFLLVKFKRHHEIVHSIKKYCWDFISSTKPLSNAI